MVHRLRRIGPLKLGIVAGACYAVISLIFIPIFLVIMIASMLIPNHDAGGPMQQALGVGSLIFFCVLAPFFYGIFGFIFGALGAVVYNLVARLIGGIEFEVE